MAEEDEERHLREASPEPRSYGAASSKVVKRPWDNAAWMALFVPVFLEGAGTALSGLVLPDMAVMSYAGSDVCTTQSEACDEAITATTAMGVTVGILGGVLTAIFSPIAGVLCDRFGRRPMLLLCLFASEFSTLASWGTYYFRWKFYWFYVTSLVPAFVPAQVVLGMWVLDMTTERNRASAYGLLAAVQVLYGFVAPLLVEFTAASANEENLTATALNMSATCKMSALLVAALFLPESKPEAGPTGPRALSDDSPQSSAHEASWYQSLCHLVEDPTTKTALTISVLGSFMSLGESEFTTQYTKNQLGVTAPQRAGLRLCGVFAALFANTVLLRMFRGVLSVKFQMVMCCLLGMVSHVLYMVASTVVAMYPATLVGALGALIGVYVSTLNANVAVSSGLPLGAVMGIFSMATQVGALTGPPIFSAVFLASLRDIFWGHPCPQITFAFGLLVNAVILRLLVAIPESAYDGRPPLPSEVAQDRDETSP